MSPGAASSVIPTCAVPEIAGLPVAAVLPGELVVPVPAGDQSPSPSALVARTCTRYAVLASRPVRTTPLPKEDGGWSWGPLVQVDSVVFW